MTYSSQALPNRQALHVSFKLQISRAAYQAKPSDIIALMADNRYYRYRYIDIVFSIEMCLPESQREPGSTPAASAYYWVIVIQLHLCLLKPQVVVYYGNLQILTFHPSVAPVSH